MCFRLGIDRKAARRAALSRLGLPPPTAQSSAEVDLPQDSQQGQTTGSPSDGPTILRTTSVESETLNPALLVGHSASLAANLGSVLTFPKCNVYFFCYGDDCHQTSITWIIGEYRRPASRIRAIMKGSPPLTDLLQAGSADHGGVAGGPQRC